MNAASSQKYAFLFTDVEGSTRLAQQFPEKMVASLERHNNILNEVFARLQGQVFEIVGDAYCVAFEDPVNAVNAAVEVQRKLGTEEWDEVKIRIRMGLHTGFAQNIGGKFSGYITMARTHRIMSAAHGGQILVSNQLHGEIAEQMKDLVSFRDLGERRLKDLIQPVRVFQLTAEGIESDFPPLKTLDARPNNLPVQLTSFIGREKELMKVKECLRESRLLTLLGTGGSGKTRLALQAGADLIDDFANGVWFVELEQVSDPVLMPTAINNSLGVQEESQKSPEESLAEFVKEKEILIILDNCEQIAEACANIAERLLKRSPKLRIVVTSREALKCEGELTHRIDSLTTPDKYRKYSFEEILDFESVRLFEERAQAVTPAFKITPENSKIVAGICTDLDGIPLAIELAAARTKVLGVDKIHERLKDRFKLLTGGRRTALPRQQTLKALIDWSYDLLTEQEKALWERLSVFAGGWTLEAAEEVCSDELIEQFDILDLLFNLNEKSIVIYDEEHERYRMLESIRQYGDEKLSAAGNRDANSSRHLKYYCDLAVKSEKGLAGEDVNNWLKILDTETGNLESAIHWSYSGGNNEEGGKLATAYANYWLNRGYLTTAVYHLETILQAEDKLSESTKGNLFGITGLFLNMLGNADKAEDLIGKSLLISRELGNKDDIASGLNNLASVVYEKGDYTKARELIEETLVIDRESGDASKISFSLINLGTVARLQGDYDTARALLEESLEIRKKAKNKFAIASSLNTLAILHVNLGDYDRARAYIEEGLALTRELGNNYGIADGLGLLGNVEASLGNFDESEKLQRESLKIFEEMGKKNKIADAISNIGNVTFQKGEYEASLEHLSRALEIQKNIGDRFGIALTLLRMGKSFTALRKYQEASEKIEESLAIRTKLGLKGGIAECCGALGFLMMLTGKSGEAESSYLKSLEIYSELKNSSGIYSALLGLSLILLKNGKPETALKLSGIASAYRPLPGVATDMFDKMILSDIEEVSPELFAAVNEASAELPAADQVAGLVTGILKGN
ncbi:MAG: tetratricopeptide repeat protein [Ignavibacteria bacterium]|nr:tetratricopeptide repeat protein [Ignavibacteria bacterium]